MLKENIQRQDLKQNIMHSIVMRIDYQGIIDISPFIKVFTNNFQNYFEIYESAFQNRVDISLTDFNEISATLSVPVKEIESQTIHRFSENKFGSDKVVLDISKYFTTLTIICTNYHSIDLYLDFFSEYCKLIYSENLYLQIKRAGIRKVGTNIYKSIKDILEDFEPEYFNFDFKKTNYESLKRELREVFQTSEGITLDYRRTFEKGFIQDENNEINPVYQVALDFDGIIQEIYINSLKFKEDPKSILQKINHHYLFDLFKMTVTDKFLYKSKA